MNATARIIAETRTDTAASADRTVLGAMAASAGIIGLWAVATLAVAAFAHGPLGLVRAWFGAVTGM